MTGFVGKKDVFLYWAPRVLSLLFIAFLSLFALDVFGEYKGLAIIPALFVHLLPSLVLLVATVAAWKYDFLGTITFLGFAIWYVWMVGFDRPWSWYVSISGPAAIAAILFFLNWVKRSRNEPGAVRHENP